MARLHCETCHGEYDDLGADGLRYFHACPPLSPRELREAIDNKTIRLTREQRAQLDAAAKADGATPATEGAPTRVELVLASLQIERPDKRDENVASVKAGSADQSIAAGKGVREVAAATVDEAQAADGIL